MDRFRSVFEIQSVEVVVVLVEVMVLVVVVLVLVTWCVAAAPEGKTPISASLPGRIGPELGWFGSSSSLDLGTWIDLRAEWDHSTSRQEQWGRDGVPWGRSSGSSRSGQTAFAHSLDAATRSKPLKKR